MGVHTRRLPVPIRTVTAPLLLVMSVAASLRDDGSLHATWYRQPGGAVVGGPMPAREDDNYNSPRGSFASGGDDGPWYHRQVAAASSQPDDSNSGIAYEQSGVSGRHSFVGPALGAIGLVGMGGDRNGGALLPGVSHGSVHINGFSPSQGSFNIGGGDGETLESGAGDPAPTTPPTPFTASPFGGARFRSLYGGAKRHSLPPFSMSTEAPSEQFTTANPIAKSIDAVGQRMVFGAKSPVIHGPAPANNLERYMPLLARKLAPHTSTSHPPSAAGELATSASVDSKVDGSVSETGAAGGERELGARTGNDLLPVDWELDGGGAPGAGEPCPPDASPSSANCRTWITITIPGGDTAKRRSKFNRRHKNKDADKCDEDEDDDDEGCGGKDKGKETSEEEEEEEGEESGEGDGDGSGAVDKDKKGKKGTPKTGDGGGEKEEDGDDDDDEDSSEPKRKNTKGKKTTKGPPLTKGPLKPVEPLPPLPPPKEPLKPVRPATQLPGRPSGPPPPRIGGSRGGKIVGRPQRPHPLPPPSSTSTPSPSIMTTPWIGGGGMVTRKYKPDFVFSTSWILPINGLVTTPLPITLPTPPPPLGTLAPPPPPAVGSIRSTATRPSGNWIRPFTLRPRPHPIPQPPFGSVVTGATPPPPPLPSRPPPPILPPFGRAIVVNGAGPAGLKAGNRNKKPTPWTHSSSTSTGGSSTSEWPRPSPHPKSRPPVPTTETSIEQAAIWMASLARENLAASTELIDAIREALEKFRASINRNGGLHNTPELQEISSQLSQTWNELRGSGWLERALSEFSRDDNHPVNGTAGIGSNQEHRVKNERQRAPRRNVPTTPGVRTNTGARAKKTRKGLEPISMTDYLREVRGKEGRGGKKETGRQNGHPDSVFAVPFQSPRLEAGWLGEKDSEINATASSITPPLLIFGDRRRLREKTQRNSEARGAIEENYNE